jgi:hypothetical protein
VLAITLQPFNFKQDILSTSLSLFYIGKGRKVIFCSIRNFSLHHRVQTGSGAHPASYPMGTRGSFPGVKLPEHEADHSPPSSAEVKRMSGAMPPLLQYAFMARCSVKAQGQL